MPHFKAKMQKTPLGANSAPQDRLAWLRGSTSKGRGGEGREGGKVGKGGEGRGGERRGGEKGRREGEGRPPNVRETR